LSFDEGFQKHTVIDSTIRLVVVAGAVVVDVSCGGDFMILYVVGFF
jgi:hypothetical protein